MWATPGPSVLGRSSFGRRVAYEVGVLVAVPCIAAYMRRVSAASPSMIRDAIGLAVAPKDCGSTPEPPSGCSDAVALTLITDGPMCWVGILMLA